MALSYDADGNVHAYNIRVWHVVTEFYALEALNALLLSKKSTRFEPYRHSHARWREEFDEYKEKVTTKLANAIYDYTVRVVAGEIRHCSEHASMYVDGISGCTERDSMYRSCVHWRPDTVLKTATKVFDDDVEWEEGFGGCKWATIAKAGLLRGKLNDVAFVDHCVDLSHNNSIYFDKGAGIFTLDVDADRYKHFLNVKYSSDPVTVLLQGYSTYTKKFIQRINALELLHCTLPVSDTMGLDEFLRTESVNSLMQYKPFRWGDAMFPSKLLENYHYIYRDSERRYDRDRR